MAFATYQDLEARWRPLNEAEQARATVLLDDAAVYLSRYVDVCGCDDSQFAALKIVSCSMVIRAMSNADSDAFGVSEQTIKADIYSQSWKYANPSGDLYLTAGEKRMLGITGSYLKSLRPTINPVRVRYENLWRDR